MIKSFHGKETGKIWIGQRSRRLPQDIQQLARRKLRMRIPPANRLERLKGDRAGQYSVRINEIVHGKRAVTADTALRLARYFGSSEAFWMGLQADYDLEEARQRLGDRLDREVRSRAA
jgi:hypothetical protein